MWLYLMPFKRGLEGSDITVKEVDADINDPRWAKSIARRLAELVEERAMVKS